MRVLDLGCGTGFPAIELAQRLGSESVVHAVDLWGAALDRARFKADVSGVRNVVFQVASAAALPFDNSEFDLVTSNLGINNFERRSDVVRECKRVLRTAGQLIFTTNLVGHMSEFYHHFREVLREADEEKLVAALDAQENSRMTLELTRSLLEGEGFKIEDVWERTLQMRFASGSALFGHSFVKLAFLEGWQGVVAPAAQSSHFTHLENRLNEVAAQRNGLQLTVPMCCILATKPREI